MAFKANIKTVLSICTVLLITTPFVASNNFKLSLSSFSRNLFSELLQSNGDKNIIYSPISVQTSLAMVRMGADGQTAAEMDRGLSMTGQAPENVANNYYSLLANYENSSIVNIANKIYVAKNVQIQDTYNQLLSKKFFSSVENIDFAQNEKSANAINTWVESKTNGAIKNLVSPDLLSADTRVFLLSAIHFKGEWEIPFEPKYTREDDFFYTENKSTKVPLMVNTDIYDYELFPRLDATAVRLFYKNSQISMMIILPNQRTGLDYLLDLMENIEFGSLLQKMRRRTSVTIHLPKFTAEFQTELKPDLQNLGMEQLFADANLNKMFKSDESLEISNVLHKAFIDVSETGTEAAAATGIVGTSRMAMDSFTFKCDHPFYYAIVNGNNIKLFEGTVVKF